MMQKLIKVGNSKALTISSSILAQVGNVEVAKVRFEASKKRLIVDFDSEEVANEIVNAEVYDVAKKLMSRYGKAFAQLAKK